MARRSQWRLWTLSATLIVLLRAGWIAVMTVVLQNGRSRQLTPRELAELNGEAPAHSGRQSHPGHDRRRKSLLHGASRPSGSTPATRRGRAARDQLHAHRVRGWERQPCPGTLGLAWSGACLVGREPRWVLHRPPG